MSASTHVYGFPTAIPDEAPAILQAIEAALRDHDLVTGDHAPDASYSQATRTLCPGKAAFDFPGWAPMRSSIVNGVTFNGPGYGNFLGMNMGDLTCTTCSAQWAPDDAGYGALFNALGESTVPFTAGGPLTDISCPACDAGQDINAWFDHLILAHAAIELWNWNGRDPAAPSPPGDMTTWPMAADAAAQVIAAAIPDHPLMAGSGHL